MVARVGHPARSPLEFTIAGISIVEYVFAIDLISADLEGRRHAQTRDYNNNDSLIPLDGHNDAYAKLDYTCHCSNVCA